MVWLARELIEDSLELANIVAPAAQTPQGFEMTKGLRLLNRLLNFKQVDVAFVPYFKYLQDMTTNPGQEKYFLEGVSYVQTITFNYGTVRFPLEYKTPKEYFGPSRVNDINSLPSIYTTVRVKGGTDVYIYFAPSDTYTLNIFGKTFLDEVTLDTDLEDTYDAAYIEYLRWYLAKYICTYFSRPIPQDVKDQLEEIENTLRYLSPPDPAVTKVSILQDGTVLGWNWANLGKSGWFPY